MPKDFSGKNILISRTDNLGDVMLSLPVAGFLKSIYPGCTIYFLGKSYTKPLIDSCIYVDHFLDFKSFLSQHKNENGIELIIHLFPNKEVAFKARSLKIPFRLGTRNRIFHWLSCNILSTLSRRNSDLHESVLNLKLLEPITGKQNINQDQLWQWSGFEPKFELKEEWKSLPDPNKIKVILHPKSKGSAREWGLENFGILINNLSKTGSYQLFLSGTEQEGVLMKEWKKNFPSVVDLTGKMDLSQFIAFINACDGLVAASTGPLHIASALGKKAIGIYAPMRPIHAGRWAPIGPSSKALSLNKECNDCAKSGDCKCIREIEATAVERLL